jgi:hypothetical protein
VRAANPVRVSDERVHEPAAQAALQRILADGEPTDACASQAHPRRSATVRWRGVGIVLAVMVLGAGGAVAASDPFGWWSNNRDEARYGSNPAIHVATATAQQIRCVAGPGGGFTCTAERLTCSATPAGRPACEITGAGAAYEKLDAIRPPEGARFNRAFVDAAIDRAVRSRTMTAAQAAKIRGDLARVPDSFFAKLRLASRYGTYGNANTNGRGQQLVPPAGVPDILVCESAGEHLSCRDLNGDLNAPVGAGVYGALPGKGWRLTPAPRESGLLPPGIHFSPVEARLLVDLLTTAMARSSSSSRGHVATPIRLGGRRPPRP